MSSSGLKSAIRYSLPPSRLRFCGPSGQDNWGALLDFAADKKISELKVQSILEKFEALYPYLRLIASSNEIKDPFDEPVVKAYWVGNKLLDAVSVGELRQMIRTDFTKPGLLSKEEAERRAAKIPEGAVPHHSFHVLFLGSVTGRVKLEGALKDLCRIGWGKITKIKNQKAKIKYKPLIFVGRMRLGEEIEKEVGLPSEALAKEGDWVSFHWGRVCDLLNEEDVENLTHYTQKTISLIQGK